MKSSYRVIHIISCVVSRGDNRIFKSLTKFRAHFAALAILVLVSGANAGTVVQKGDTLWRIATRELGSGHRWREIVEINRLSKPYTIQTGQLLRLPGEALTSFPDQDYDIFLNEIIEDVPRDEEFIAVAEPEFLSTSGMAKGGNETNDINVTVSSSSLSQTSTAYPSAELMGHAKVPQSLADISERADGIPVGLETLVQIALERNLPLLAGRITTKASSTGIQLARAAFDPTYSASVTRKNDRQTAALVPPPSVTSTTTYQNKITGTFTNSTQYTLQLDTIRTLGTPQTTAFRSNYDNTYTLSLTQPLLKGLGKSIAYADVEVAQLTADASRETLEALVESTISSVENAYWTLYQAEASEQVSRNSREIAKQLLYRNSELFKRGLTAEVDVITSEQGLAQREVSMTGATQTRLDAMEALLFTVYGQSAIDELRNKHTFIRTTNVVIASPEIPSLNTAIDQSLSVRNDVAKADQDLKSALISARVTRNALLPNLDLTGSITQGGNSPSLRYNYNKNLGEVDEQIWTAGVVFSVPIGNNTAQANDEKALLNVESKRIAFETTQNAVRQEV
ncbi:MAG: TolC family protein, partial [Candidatus Lindowbacteria bacterium]|nr:TolC family protein [Candidatus Lindowbacteria bacterium]